MKGFGGPSRKCLNRSMEIPETDRSNSSSSSVGDFKPFRRAVAVRWWTWPTRIWIETSRSRFWAGGRKRLAFILILEIIRSGNSIGVSAFLFNSTLLPLFIQIHIPSTFVLIVSYPFFLPLSFLCCPTWLSNGPVAIPPFIQRRVLSFLLFRFHFLSFLFTLTRISIHFYSFYYPIFIRFPWATM